MGRRIVEMLDEAGGLLTGQLLIAMPMMDTPHFAQSVIYICAHTPEGAMGIVVNQPLKRPSFDDLLEQLEVLPAPPARRIELFRGGPVDAARGFVLHTRDWTGDGSLMVDDSVALTASLEKMTRQINAVAQHLDGKDYQPVVNPMASVRNE